MWILISFFLFCQGQNLGQGYLKGVLLQICTELRLISFLTGGIYIANLLSSTLYERKTGKTILVHCVCLLNYLFKSNRIKQKNKPVLCYSFQTKSEQQQRIYLFWYDVLLIFSKMYKLVLIFWLISNTKSNPLTQSDEYSYYIDGDEEYSASYRLFVFRRH